MPALHENKFEGHFMKEFFIDLILDLSKADNGLVYLVSLIVMTVIVIEGIAYGAKTRSKASGLGEFVKAFGIDGGKVKPGKEYISTQQGLAGKPDALILENGFIIPVEMKSVSKKLRDRHVAQLLVYCRLIEEFEGKRPPYGYLILGEDKRKVKVLNSEAKQVWLSEMLHRMHEILEGGASKASPDSYKCSRCDVNTHCQYRSSDVVVDGVSPEGLVNISKS